MWNHSHKPQLQINQKVASWKKYWSLKWKYFERFSINFTSLQLWIVRNKITIEQRYEGMRDGSKHI